jgi:hypothetical protein
MVNAQCGLLPRPGRTRPQEPIHTSAILVTTLADELVCDKTTEQVSNFFAIWRLKLFWHGRTPQAILAIRPVAAPVTSPVGLLQSPLTRLGCAAPPSPARGEGTQR